jgi:putative transposase
VSYGFVAKHRAIWPIELLCAALGVARSGFSAWRTRPPSARTRRDAELGVEVRTSFLASDRTYGARRVWRDVLASGHRCGLHGVESLMRVHGLRAWPRRRARPMDRGARGLEAPALNVLDRQFTASAPNQKWVADFTYVWTAEGWLYVAVVLDLYARRISTRAGSSAGRCTRR